MSSSDHPASGDAIPLDERRRRMLERLNTRHAVSQTSRSSQRNKSSTESDSTLHSALPHFIDIDELLSRVRRLLDDSESRIEPAILKEIEEAFSVSQTGLQSRRLREGYNELRVRLQRQLNGGQKPSAFAFSSKPTIANTPSEPVASNVGRSPPTHEEKSESSETASSSNGSKIAPKTSALPSNTVTISDKENEFIKVDGQGGEDVLISSLNNCHLSIGFQASTVHLKNIHNSCIVLAPVSSSILIRNCSSVTLVAAAHQIRVHDSRELKLHIAVRSAIVIEDCDEFQIAPYRVKDVQLDWIDTNNNWRRVQDFNWLSDEPNPHWCLMNESEWCMFDLRTCQACSQ